ncbi:MAG: hypothetical protein ACR2PT_21045 [Endozoicomonas sp.]
MNYALKRFQTGLVHIGAALLLNTHLSNALGANTTPEDKKSDIEAKVVVHPDTLCALTKQDLEHLTEEVENTKKKIENNKKDVMLIHTRCTIIQSKQYISKVLCGLLPDCMNSMIFSNLTLTREYLKPMLISHQLIGQLNSLPELEAVFRTLNDWQEENVSKNLKTFWHQAAVSTGFPEDDDPIIKQNHLAEIFIHAAISYLKKEPIDYVYQAGNEKHVYRISAYRADNGSVEATWELLY